MSPLQRTVENSPAIYCWVRVEIRSSESASADDWHQNTWRESYSMPCRVSSSINSYLSVVRWSGLAWPYLNSYPTINCWAIIGRPLKRTCLIANFAFA